MPRIGATLAAFALIACSIAVNISRYPVVWEMTAPATQVSASPQSAQSEASSAEGAVPLAASAPVSTPEPMVAEGVAPGRAFPVEQSCGAVCSTDSGVYCAGPPPCAPPESAWQENTTDPPSAPAGSPMVAVQIAGDPSPPVDEGPAAETAGQAGNSAGVDLYPNAASFAPSPGPAPNETAATGEPDTPGFAAEKPMPANAVGPQPAAAGTTAECDTAASYLPEDAPGEAEEVEPGGPYAGVASVSGVEEGHDTAPMSISDGYAVGDASEAVDVPASDSGRPIVPIVPTVPDETTEGASLVGGKVVATLETPPAPGADVRRLPPVNEINPFLNDGYNPPVPDVSGMDYPSTGAE